jgi:hypothetical protein
LSQASEVITRELLQTGHLWRTSYFIYIPFLSFYRFKTLIERFSAAGNTVFSVAEFLRANLFFNAFHKESKGLDLLKVLFM